MSAHNCDDCGTRMRVFDTSHGGDLTYRKLRCQCGSGFETVERRSKRLPSLATNSQPLPAVETGRTLDISSSQESSLPLRSNPDQTQARVRAEPAPTYPQDFEQIWAGTGRRGDKFAALKAWKKRGKPGWDIVGPAHAAYVRSLPSWRNPKDLSTWLNNYGHTQTYGDPPPEPKRESANGRETFEAQRNREREEAIARESERLVFGKAWG